MENRQNGAKIVSSALLGMDVGTCVVNRKAYFIKPPTIKKLVGAGYYLSDLDEGNDVASLLRSLGKDSVAHALSWLIQGDDSLSGELSEGTFDECVEGLSVAFSMIHTQNFLQLSVLTKSIGRLIARPKQ